MKQASGMNRELRSLTDLGATGGERIESIADRHEATNHGSGITSHERGQACMNDVRITSCEF